MLALSPRAETVSPVSSAHHACTSYLWVALDQALNDVDDWAESYVRCTFVDRGRSRTLMVEKVGADRLLVSQHQQDGALRPQPTTWLLTLDSGTVHDVTFNGAPADLEAMEELADLLWTFHRLAVEDRVAMLRE